MTKREIFSEFAKKSGNSFITLGADFFHGCNDQIADDFAMNIMPAGYDNIIINIGDWEDRGNEEIKNALEKIEMAKLGSLDGMIFFLRYDFKKSEVEKWDAAERTIKEFAETLREMLGLVRDKNYMCSHTFSGVEEDPDNNPNGIIIFRKPYAFASPPQR